MVKQLNISNVASRNDKNFRYKMDPLETKVEGRGNGIKTILKNIETIASQMRSDPRYITKYLGIEVGAQSSWKEKRRVGVVNGSHNQADLQEKLYEFIQLFILCPNCELPELRHLVKGNVVGAKCLSCGKVGPIKGPKGQQHNIFKFVVKHPPKKEKRERKPKKPSKQMAVRGSGHESTSPSRGTPKDKLDLQFEGWHMDGDAKRTETEREIEERVSRELIMNTSKETPNAPVALLRFILQRDGMKLVDIVSEFQRIKIAHQLDEAETKLGRVLVDAVFDFSSFETFAESIEKHANLLSWYSADRETAKILISYIEEAIVDGDFWEYAPMILEKFYDSNVFDEEFLLHWFNQPPENSYVVQDPEEILKIKLKSKPFIDWVSSVYEKPADKTLKAEEESEVMVNPANEYAI